jgi:long-chain fatty acid transport protein
MALVPVARRLLLPAALLAVLAASAAARAQTAHALNEVGPVNTSMGGASTALPLDASGALFWNPATLPGLPSSEADFGFEILLAHSHLFSAYSPNVFGRGVPPVPLAGETGDTELVPIPNFAVAWKYPDSPLAFGMSVAGLAGFNLNYGASTTNPILTPQAPRGLGFGAVYSDYEVLQMAPAVAYQVNEHWSVGLGPTIDLASLAASPFPFATPDDADGDGFATYPSALRKDYAWGAGFQAGVYYNGDGGIHLGLNVKTPQWFQSFFFKSEDELGRPRTLKFDIDYPLLVTTGVAYTGLEHFAFAADFRYLNYKDTNGFGPQGFGPGGVLRGLGFNDVFVAAFGVQYAPGGPLTFRLGYSYNTKPIPSQYTSVNIASPTINQNTFYCGLSFQMAENWLLSLAYGHGFSNDNTGPLLLPGGPVPGTAVRSTTSADALVGGLTIRF